MQPTLFVVFNEMGQESRCRACARSVRRASNIVQVSKVGRQMRTVELFQRQAPERLVLGFRAVLQLSRQLIVETEQGMIFIAQCSFGSPRQGGRIDEQLRI